MEMNLGSHSDSLIPLLSLIITLVSVVVGPLIALKIAKKQIHASVVSSTRQIWISSLRDVLAEYITLANHVAAANATGNLKAEHVDKIHALVLLQNKIRLFLDPAEIANQRLMDLAERIRSKAFKLTPETASELPEEFKPLCDEFMVLSQVILKHERVVIEMESGS